MTGKGIDRATVSIFGYLAGGPIFIRSMAVGILLEDFFVSAVGSLLAIRLYLSVTGYPSLGSGGLHIAHVIWGGLLMLAALIFLLSFLDSRSRFVGAVLGGVGFGAFIDELGKFVTRDNDYFFQPAVALIYVVFVGLFLTIRTVARERRLSTEECLANVFDLAREGSLQGITPEDMDVAMKLLDECGDGALKDSLGAVLEHIQPARPKRARPLDSLRFVIHRSYERAVTKRWFGGVVITFFAMSAITAALSAAALVQWSLALVLWVVAASIMSGFLAWSRRTSVRYKYIGATVSIVVISMLVSWAIIANLRGQPGSVIEWAQLVFPAGYSGLVLAGILALPRSRLNAYHIFRWATLSAIFLTQVLSFYEQQLLALVGLIANVLVLGALRYLVAREQVGGGAAAVD